MLRLMIYTWLWPAPPASLCGTRKGRATVPPTLEHLGFAVSSSKLIVYRRCSDQFPAGHCRTSGGGKNVLPHARARGYYQAAGLLTVFPLGKVKGSDS